MFKEGNKRGQVTLFIIIAVIIVALAALVYLFFPSIQSIFGLTTDNPQIFLQNCLEDDMFNTVSAISLQGGTMTPSNYYTYGGSDIEYLCYTNENYSPCVMQQPLLQPSIENEIKNELQDNVRNCFDLMKESFESRGYTFELSSGQIYAELLPKRVVLNADYKLRLSKEDSQVYDSFRVVVNNNLYELVGIANSILNWETNFGDAETTTYMDYYPNIKVEKKKQEDGSKVYILTERDGSGIFQFATRSYVWPPGYGI